MKRRLLSLLLCIGILCLCVTGCGDDGTGGGFRFPLEAEPVGLDPQTATDTAAVTVISALFEGLTRLDQDGNVVAGAADWSVSDDQKTYTFTLRDSYWSCLHLRGEETPWDTPTPVTAQDYVFAWQRAVDPQTGSAVAVEFDTIKNARAIRNGKARVASLGVQATDDKTLVVTLAKADPHFLSRLATTPFMPCNQAFFEYTKGRYGLEKEYLISNGPFWLGAWNHDESLLLYKHYDYHDADTVTPEAVRYVIGTEDPVAELAAGGLDAALLTAEQSAAAPAGATLHPLQDTLRSLWFNTASDPFTVTALRRCLRDSIQWDTLHGVYDGIRDETPAQGYVTPEAVVGGNDVYRNEENAIPYATRVAGAKKLMAQGLQQLESGSLRFELLAADDPVSADIARYLVQSWQKNLGIYPTLTLLPAADLNRRVQNGNYQAAIYTHTPTGNTAAENLAMFGSDSVGNLSNLKNKDVDAAVEAAQKGGRQAVLTLEKRLWQACPCIPLSVVTRYYAVAEDTEGIHPRPFGGGRYAAPLYFREALKFD